jgi:hypothetical protein
MLEKQGNACVCACVCVCARAREHAYVMFPPGVHEQQITVSRGRVNLPQLVLCLKEPVA